MIKVCHFSSAHKSTDDRIFLKECKSLAKAGYETYLVAKGESREDGGVRVIGLGEPPRSRRERMTKFAKKAYEVAFGLNADVYHFHDPELLPYGIRLKKLGKKVIFDSHEDVPAQIADKVWIPSAMRFGIAAGYRAYETHAARMFDAVIAATPHIADQFRGRARKVVVVNNYPILDDIVFQTKPFSEREAIVCYTGGISEARGEKVMLKAMDGVEGTLILAGSRSDHTVQESTGGGKFILVSSIGRKLIKYMELR